LQDITVENHAVRLVKKSKANRASKKGKEQGLLFAFFDALESPLSKAA